MHRAVIGCVFGPWVPTEGRLAWEQGTDPSEPLRGGPRPSRSGAAARSGAGAEGMRGGSPDLSGGERADRIWSLREAWSEVAPCAAGPHGGAQLCGGLGPPAPPQYLHVCRWVSMCDCACLCPGL